MGARSGSHGKITFDAAADARGVGTLNQAMCGAWGLSYDEDFSEVRHFVPSITAGAINLVEQIPNGWTKITGTLSGFLDGTYTAAAAVGDAGTFNPLFAFSADGVAVSLVLNEGQEAGSTKWTFNAKMSNFSKSINEGTANTWTATFVARTTPTPSAQA